MKTPFRKPPMKLLAAAGVTATMVAVPAAASATTLTGSGSSAAQPYMLELFKSYSQINKSIHFKYIADGGNAGVKDVQAGRSQFAINTRPPLPSDAGTTYVKLFLDGLCIGVNRANSLTNISMTDLKNVFLGVDTNWGQVGGSSLSTTIDPIGRNSAAGQYTFFQSSVLGGATQASDVAQDTSDGLVQIGIGKDPNSIGYVGLSHSGPPGEEALGQRCELHRDEHPQGELPALPLRLGRRPDRQDQPPGDQVPGVGPHQQDRGRGHRQGRRSRRVQQAVGAGHPVTD